jgi:hypothetical protein
MTEIRAEQEQQLEGGNEPVADEIAPAPAAQEDVSGHAIINVNGRPFPLPDDYRNPVPPTRVGHDGPTLDPPRLPGQPRVS